MSNSKFNIQQYTQPQISNLHPYQPGISIAELARTHNLNEKDIIKLASNENPYGPSPQVQNIVLEYASESHRYPDSFALQEALANHYGHNLTANNIIVGNGSNDILDLIARTFLGINTNAVSSQYSFMVYDLVTRLVGSKNTIVPAREYGHDLSAMQQAINTETRVIWIANPNNPTGTFLDCKTIKEFLQAVPENVFVVLDEAYYEYLADAKKEDTIAWLNSHPNLIVVRTFSKIYGLAGLRIGYAVAHPTIIELLHRVRQPFNANTLGLAAAIAALKDTSHTAMSREQNHAELRKLENSLRELKIDFIPSSANFITIRLQDTQGAIRELLQKGIIVRGLANYGLPDHIRVTIGKPKENIQLIEALREIIT